MNLPRFVYVLESKLPIFAQINVDLTLKTASKSCVAISPADHRAATFDAKAQADPSTDRVPHCSGPLRIQVPVPWKHPRIALDQTGDLLKFTQIIKVSSGKGNHPQIRWPRFRLVNCDNLNWRSNYKPAVPF